jgi:hypothetical protein
LTASIEQAAETGQDPLAGTVTARALVAFFGPPLVGD